MYLNLVNSNSPFLIASTQGILASKSRHIDMVSDKHDVTHFKFRFEPSSSIGHNQSLNPEKEKHSYWICDLKQKEKTLRFRAALTNCSHLYETGN